MDMCDLLMLLFGVLAGVFVGWVLLEFYLVWREG